MNDVHFKTFFLFIYSASVLIANQSLVSFSLKLVDPKFHQIPREKRMLFKKMPNCDLWFSISLSLQTFTGQKMSRICFSSNCLICFTIQFGERHFNCIKELFVLNPYFLCIKFVVIEHMSYIFIWISLHP